MIRGYALALGSAVFIGMNTLANKIILNAGIDALTAGALTYLCASCVFVPLAIRSLSRGRLPRGIKSSVLAWWLLSGAVCGPVLYFLGLERTSAIHGSILNNLESAFTAVLAFGFFRERLDRRGVVGSILILTGAAWLSWPAPAQTAASAGQVTVTGDILMAIGYFFWALEANLIRLMDPSVPAVVMLAAKTMATSLVMAVLSLWKGSGLAVPRSTIPAIVASGGVFLVLSVLFYYTATRLIGAGRCGLIISTSGFFGTMGAVLFLREAFSTGMIAPISVIALGLAALVGVSPASRSRSRSSDGHGGS